MLIAVADGALVVTVGVGGRGDDAVDDGIVVLVRGTVPVGVFIAGFDCVGVLVDGTGVTVAVGVLVDVFVLVGVGSVVLVGVAVLVAGRAVLVVVGSGELVGVDVLGDVVVVPVAAVGTGENAGAPVAVDDGVAVALDTLVGVRDGIVVGMIVLVAVVPGVVAAVAVADGVVVAVALDTLVGVLLGVVGVGVVSSSCDELNSVAV